MLNAKCKIVVFAKRTNWDLAKQCLPLWGRWIAEGETDEGGTMFYVHKHFGEMGNPHPTSLTLGHLPQRGRLWPDKLEFG